MTAIHRLTAAETIEGIRDGRLCVQCVVAMPGRPPGYPRYCSPACRRAATADRIPADPSTPKMLCPECGRKIKVAGARDHLKDVHGITEKKCTP